MVGCRRQRSEGGCIDEERHLDDDAIAAGPTWLDQIRWHRTVNRTICQPGQWLMFRNQNRHRRHHVYGRPPAAQRYSEVVGSPILAYGITVVTMCAAE